MESKFAEESENDEEQKTPDDEKLEQAAEPQAQEDQGPDLNELANMPPDQAIVAMRDIFANDQEMQTVLDQLETLPPDQQSQMITQMLSTGDQGAPV